MRDKIYLKLAWLLPKRLAYWCAIRVGAHATTGEHGDTIIPELTFMEVLKRWE